MVWHGTAGRTIHTPLSGRRGRMHSTAAGRASGAFTSIDGWNLGALRVGAPYLVERDDTIYKTFDDTTWIYHLGIKGTNGPYDKASVAIEFANELGLALDGDRLYVFGMNTPNTVYTGPFFAFDWRDYSYFAQMDEAQVDAGIDLPLDICRRHDIEPSFYYPQRRST